MPKKPSSRDKARQEAIAHFEHLLDEAEARRQAAEGDSYEAQKAFWQRVRAALFVNAASSGLETFDAVTEAVLNGADSAVAWRTPILLLPPVSQQRDMLLVVGDSTRSPDKRTREDPDDGSQPPAKRRKKESGKKPSSGKATPSPTTGTAPAPAEVVTQLAAEDTEKLGYELANSTPARVRADLYKIAEQAASAGRAPYQLAYPWAGVRLWYNPSRYPSVHLAHWRFMMVWRPMLWLCAMHPPFPPGTLQARYRKKKMRACRVRLRFLSYCIESWGFVAFLELLQVGGTRLLWLGGRPGRQIPKAPKSSGDLDQNLGTLYFTDRSRYKRRIEAALDPVNIDQEGYASVAELLEQSRALDPDAVPEGRLSDDALARVRADWVNNKRFRPAWKTKELVAAYEKLRGDTRIGGIEVEDGFQDVYLPAYVSSESEREGADPFKLKTGAFTALAPSSGGIAVYSTAKSSTPNKPPASSVNVPAAKTTKDTLSPQVAEESMVAKVTKAALFGEGDSSSSDDESDDEEAGEARANDAEKTSDTEAKPPAVEEELKSPAPTRASPKVKKANIRTRSASKKA